MKRNRREKKNSKRNWVPFRRNRDGKDEEEKKKKTREFIYKNQKDEK